MVFPVRNVSRKALRCPGMILSLPACLPTPLPPPFALPRAPAPPSYPPRLLRRAHSIQAVSDGGAEFLLVFDDGSFSEDETFLLSDFLSHIPREVLSKNFPEGFNNSDFDNLPDSELYIFPAPAGVVPYAEDANVDNPQGQTQQAYTYNASAHPATQLPGGSVKIVDSRNFSVTDISLAEITINPGAIRELHWHPNSDEWSYFLSGHARITVWAGTNNARTFDYQAGDVVSILGFWRCLLHATIHSDAVHLLPTPRTAPAPPSAAPSPIPLLPRPFRAPSAPLPLSTRRPTSPSHKATTLKP